MPVPPNLMSAILPTGWNDPNQSALQLPKRDPNAAMTLGQKLAAAASGLMGINPYEVNDYQGQRYNALGEGAQQLLLPTLGVTTFLTKAGVPDIPKRLAATTTAMGNLEQTLTNLNVPREVIDQTLQTAAKFPRVMAHNDDIYTPGWFEKLTGSFPRGANGVNEPSVNKLGRAEIMISPESPDPSQTFFHELTHTAQRIGQKDKVDQMYNQAESQFGYDNNPYEVSARAVAARRAPTSMSNILNAVLKLPR